MTDAERKPPAFFCPLCGQKHRADLTPLEQRPGASVTTRCRRCDKPLSVHLEDGRPVCEAVPDPEPVEPAASPAPAAPEEEPAKPPRERRRGRGRKARSRAEPAGGEEPATAKPAIAAAPAHTPYDAALADKPLEAGAEVGRYTIKSVVTNGLTSTVYRAHDPTTKRSVGVKILGAKAPSDVRERFLRQVDVQAKIRHPSVLPVYDRGELTDGRPFMATELLHHPLTLSDLLERRAEGTLGEQRKLAPLAELETLVDDVLVPVADGVYVANVETGVVHGDLRPENVLIDGHTLRPYVVDFGRASAVGGEEGGEAVAMPSTHYLSPEQAHGRVHARTDVWGLGALLHVLVTGRPPLEGSGDQLRQAAAEGRYRPLPPTTPPVLAAIVQKAMAPRPEDRYVNARQLTADLKAWRHGRRVRAVDEFGGPGATVEEKKKALRVRLRNVGWIAAGLLVGLLVGSRIRIGGEDPSEVRVRGIEQLVDRYEQDVSELDQQLRSAPAGLGYSPFVAAVDPAEAYGIWRSLDGRGEALSRRLATLEASPLRDSIQARVAYARGRLLPAPVVIDAPEGLEITAVNVPTGDTLDLRPGTVHLPPGHWTVRLGAGDRARVPVCIPLSARPQGTEPDQVEPRARWSVPVEPSALPMSRVLVVGTEVHAQHLPFGAPGEAIQVATFAVDREPVTNAEYARFLAAVPEAERADRAPSKGLELSRARVWRPASGMGRLPVEGIRPVDARAYCAWASGEEGVTLRLPTEAEWLLASGEECSALSRGDLAAPITPPYGMSPMPEGLAEMVAGGIARRSDATWQATKLVDDAPAAGVGFRCVQVLPTPE